MALDGDGRENVSFLMTLQIEVLTQPLFQTYHMTKEKSTQQNKSCLK